MAIKKIKPLPVDLLRNCCDPDQFDFSTTADLEDYFDFVGQDRAITAATFGINIARDGFNIYALGPAGIGKRSVIRALLEKEAAKKPEPKDICYIHNFQKPRYPQVLLLKAGMGIKLAADVQQLIDILRTSIPAIFESKEYVERIKEIQEESREIEEKALAEIDQVAKSYGLAILRTPKGFVLASAKENGEILSEQEFAALPEEEKKQQEERMRKLSKELSTYLEKITILQKEHREKVKAALKYHTMLQVGTVFDEIKNKYKDEPDITTYLKNVQQAILDTPSDFRKKSDAAANVFNFGLDDSLFNRYLINVIVDHSQSKAVPIIFEDNPSFSNLVGRIDQVSHFGALITDFTLIRAGALHKANGGYLLLDVQKLLTQPYAWEGLKRVLRAKNIYVENIQQLLGITTTVSLEPEPVPLDLKVVLFGERMIYYLLCSLDPDFLDLFKVAADFNEDITRNPENNLLFARLLSNLAKKDGLKALTKAAVALVIDHASRMVGDSKKLSTHVRLLTDLLREADHITRQRNSDVIDDIDVEQAIEQQKYRASRVSEESFENIERGLLFIDSDGNVIGQINALAYVQLGSYAFGFPIRITARVSLGSGELIDIEREAKLGGPTHSKGVLILRGYLSGQYARHAPWSLSASLVFEQSYGMIDGDSASLAEACVLLSAIGLLPLSQSLAITGSMNQHGQVQPIGGVNEKIEGFFDLCNKRALSGEQGVIIPKANIEGLMLKKEILDAVRDKKFHIYAVETIDEAMSLLTGMDAGTRNAKGDFPKNSVNGTIEAAINDFAKKRRGVLKRHAEKNK